MVQVIESKILQKWSKEKQKLLQVGRKFELFILFYFLKFIVNSPLGLFRDKY